MLAKVSEFRWQVFGGGYVCEEHELNGEKVRCIDPDMDNGEGFSVTDRYPLEEDPALFREFAAVELTEEGILAFANEWGPLKNELNFWEEYLHEDEEPSSFNWTFEPTKLWFDEITKMKALVGLWDVLESKDRDISEVIEVKKSEEYEELNGRISFRIAPKLGWNFFFLKRDRPRGGLRELARMGLLDMINESLWGVCSPWLDVGASTNENTLRLTPHHLNAALWLMFAQEIMGEKTLKQCQYCKKHFEIATEENERRQRSDRKYCSSKCRAGAHRERSERSSGETDSE